MGALVFLLIVSGGVATTEANPVTCSTVNGSCFTGKAYKMETLDGLTDPSVCCARCQNTTGCTL